MTNVTTNEYKVLRALLTNHFGTECRLDSFEESVGKWADCIDDAEEPCLLSPSSLGGVVSSLAKKGLVYCYGTGRDAVIDVTRQGWEAGQ